MAEGKKGWKWWQKLGLGLGLVLLILLLAFMGCRRTWIRPLPNVRMTLDTPAMRETDLPPESGYCLLGKAVNGLSIIMPGFGGMENKWRNAQAKLRNQPWPDGIAREHEDSVPPTTPGEEDLDVGAYNAPWTPEQCRSLLDSLSRHEKRVALLDQAIAAALPPMVIPAERPGPDSPDMCSEQVMVRWLAVSAECHRARGDRGNCFRDLRRIWSMNAILGRDCSTIDQVVVAASNRHAVESAWYAATRHDVDAAILKETAASALRAADSSPSAADLLRGWGQATAEFLDNAYSDGDPMPELIRRELFPGANRRTVERVARRIAPPLTWLTGSTRAAVTRHLAAFSGHAVAIAEAPYSAKTVPAYEALASRPASRKEALGILVSVRDPAGYFLAADQSQACGDLHRRYVANQAQLRGIALFLALKAYEKDNGNIPETLDQLVPGYLPRVPKDPYDGELFRYLKSGVPGLPSKAWAVYSIGFDFADDGGKGASFRPYIRIGSSPPPDIVWPSVPYPAMPPSAKTPAKP